MMSDAKRGRGKAELSPELASYGIHSRLPDELLQEILSRLPSRKSVVQCKSVCKRWASLVTSPFFIGRFIADKNRKQLRVFGILLYTNYLTPNKRIWRCLTMNLRGTLLIPENVSVFSLPTLQDENTSYFDVLAFCNDLMFISQKSKESSRDYYICNAQTNQRLLLPSLAFDNRFICCAFTCDPYYHSSYEDETIIDATYRYSIVVIPCRNYHETVMITTYLLSNANKNFTGEWREIVLSVPKRVELLASPGFVFDGKFHFNCINFIISFDPYDEDGNNSGVFNCDLIDFPRMPLWGSRKFQEYQGQLHMYVNYTSDDLQIWCLKDYKTSDWSLLHNIPVEDWIIRDERLSRCFDTMSLIGAHPTNPCGVYAIFQDWVILCNLSARKVEIVSHIKEGYAYSMGSPKRYFYVCDPFILPTWPTPLPTLN